MLMDLLGASAWSALGLIGGWYLGDEARRRRELDRRYQHGSYHRSAEHHRPAHRRRFRRFEE